MRQRCSFLGALASGDRMVRLRRMACPYAASEVQVTRSDTPRVSIAVPEVAKPQRQVRRGQRHAVRHPAEEAACVRSPH